MATVRERRDGVWEVRVFTGRDAQGRPTQVSRTVRGGKRDAQRVAAQLDAQPTSNAAGRTVADVLAAWLEVNEGVWSEASRRDYASRTALVAADAIARIAVARLGVGDVEHWHARMRKAKVGETAIRNRHSALRSALSQELFHRALGNNDAPAETDVGEGTSRPCDTEQSSFRRRGAFPLERSSSGRFLM